MFGAHQLFSSVLLNFVTKEVCYPSYGCYNNAPPYNIPFALLPSNPLVLNTTYMLFSRHHLPVNFTAPFHTTLKNTEMRKKKKTVIIAHGYLEKTDAYWFKPIVKELLKSEDMNVIWVDWSSGAAFPYSQAVGNSRIVATEITMLIIELLKKRLVTPSSLHLIGFSTGAHVMGRVGYLLQQENIKVDRITGLDPAGPSFKGADPVIRLDSSDAVFVDAIHSDAENPILGTTNQEGHVDFYPNGAGLQAGCKRVTADIFSQRKLMKYFGCSHFRAIDYFIESINNKNHFSSVQCESYEQFLKGGCTKCYYDNSSTSTKKTTRHCNRMGYHTSRHARGRFYLLTNSKTNFSAYHYSVSFRTGGREEKYDEFDEASFDGSLKLRIFGEKGSKNVSFPKSHYAIDSQTTYIFIAPDRLGNISHIDITVSTNSWFADAWFLNEVTVKSIDDGEIYNGYAKTWIRDEQVIRIQFQRRKCKTSES